MSARGHVFALLAMAFEILLGVDHLGARAVAEAGRGPGRGLLEICTGAGVIWVTPDGRPAGPGQAGAGHAPCAVCASVAVGALDAPPAGAVWAAPIRAEFPLALAPPAAPRAPWRAAPSPGLIRAPPGAA